MEDHNSQTYHGTADIVLSPAVSTLEQSTTNMIIWEARPNRAGDPPPSMRGVTGHIRSNNGPEFIAKAVQDWIASAGAKTAYIPPCSPWENGYIESFNARMRHELPCGEIFCSPKKARIIAETALALQHPEAACLAWDFVHQHRRSSSRKQSNQLKHYR